MRKRLALILCTLTGIGCAKTREIKGIGRIQTPSSLDMVLHHRQNEDFAIIKIERWAGTWVPGGVTSVRAVLVLGVAAPDRGLDAARKEARAWAQSHCSRADANGACDFEQNDTKGPSWLVTAEDPAKRITMAYRVLQKDASREEALETLHAALASFQPVADPAAYFAEIRERPLRDAKAGARREQKMLGWFKKHGWPAPELEKNVQHGDCAYFWTHRNGSELYIACRFGSRPKSKPLETGYAERNGFGVVTYEDFQGTWMLRRPGQVLDITLQPWPSFAADAYDSDRIYYFLEGYTGIQYEDVADAADLPDDLLGELMAARAGWRD